MNQRLFVIAWTIMAVASLMDAFWTFRVLSHCNHYCEGNPAFRWLVERGHSVLTYSAISLFHVFGGWFLIIAVPKVAASDSWMNAEILFNCLALFAGCKALVNLSQVYTWQAAHFECLAGMHQE